jgi:hypothetical protein
MGQTIFLAVIGDVVASRGVQDRRELQGRLRKAVDLVNKRYASSIVSHFVLTIGDEFQGLLRSVKEIDRLLALLRSTVHPVELRMGLGIGELDTALEPIALGMDGPCFHRARAAIERAERRSTPIEAEAEMEEPCFGIYSLLYAGLRRGWTERQQQVVDLAMSGMSGKSIAAELGITPSAVSQHRRAAEAKLVLDATRIWMNALRKAFHLQE